MKIGRMISVPIASHAALKTGVHGVAAAYLAKTSQADQDLSDAEIPAAIARDQEVIDAIAFHAAIATAHQDAPALINAHSIAVDPHGDRAYTDTEVGALAAKTVVVGKAADEVVNNNASVQNDDELLLPVGADDVWFIHLFLKALSETTTPRLRWAFAVPSGGDLRYNMKFDTAAPGALSDGTVESNLGITNTAQAIQVLYLYIGGGTPGNVQLQWAQWTATVEDTTVKANSFLICHRLAP